MSAPKDGGFTGEAGTISPEKIARGLGLGGPESLKQPEGGTGKPKLTPAQQRAKEENKPIPKSPTGFTRTVVQGGRAAWEFFGRPSTAPIGDQPEGQPIPEEFIPKEDEDRIKAERGELPQRTNWDRIDEQQRNRSIGEQVEKLQDRAKRLLRKEAEVEVSRQRRRGR